MSSYYTLGSSYYTMEGKRFKPPKEADNILRLPSHIALEILSRVPVKTVIHCSNVCKAWRSLLLDPCFPHLHLAKSPLSLMLCGAPSRYWLVEFEKGLCERKRKMSKFNGENVHGVGGSIQVGSCNGLLCLTDLSLEKFYVWNPVKNECIILPEPNIKKRDWLISLSGFGFCPRTNVYKVIRLVWSTELTGMVLWNEAICEVCTLGSNIWRIIEDVPIPHDGVLICEMPLNGAIHWICSSKINDESFPLWVCAFRIEDEKWDPILLPLPLLEVPDFRLTDLHEKLSITSSQLGVLENCLVFLDTSQDSLLNIWMMKEYGVRESWTKCWSIEHHGINEICVPALLPLRLLKDGDLLLYDKFNQALVCFNPQKRLFGKERIQGVRKGSRGIAHVASFISPAKVMKEEY